MICRYLYGLRLLVLLLERMKKEEIKQILDHYKNGTATEEQLALLESWYLQYEAEGPAELEIEERSQDLETVFFRLQEEDEPVQKKLWPTMLVAASVIIALTLGIYFYPSFQKPLSMEEAVVKNGITPGGNKAYLTLANGNRIALTDASNGEIARQSGISITKTANGELVYTAMEQGTSDKPSFNTFETPKGGQYQLRLPDGTKVWLNSASTLTYPASFAMLKTRQVVLKGEAYFEVSKDKNHPFVVKTDKQEVKVLGTHFNVNAYADEPTVKTTLIEGRVIVDTEKDTKELNPGEQAVVTSSMVNVFSADIYQTMAWKNGDFVFEGASLRTIMRQISRWYDVDLSYEGTIAELQFGGSISRNKNLYEVLRALEMTRGVHFKIEGRRVLVMP